MVLQKTAKGREEIEKRTFRIDSRRRTLLILVDGKASAAELAQKAGHIGEAVPLLGTLLAEGFVEPAGGHKLADILAPSRAPAAPSGAGTGTDLAQLKRKAGAELVRLMGPDGDAFALRLEKADTLADFTVQAAKARDVLRAVAGARKADEFWSALGL